MTDHSLHFDPSCEECAYLARPVAIPAPPSPVAGLREAADALVDEWDAAMRGDAPLDGHYQRQALERLRAALLDEPVPLDVERLARALCDSTADGDPRVGGVRWKYRTDDERAIRIADMRNVAGEYARLTDLKGATDGE